MPDYGAKVADRTIAEIDRRLKQTYQTARKELEEKLKDFEKRHERIDREKRQKLAEGKITLAEYKTWLSGQVFIRKQWENQIKQVSETLRRSNEEAVKIINERRLDVFAENYNYTAFHAEAVTGINFNIYNTQAVAKLIQDDPQILPEWKIDEGKNYQWDYKKVNNIVQQAIIQGEGIPQITKRLCTDLSAMSESRMRTFARTAITGAQNAGRQQQMDDAAEMGIEVHKQWLATLDSRTRDSHRHLDGQEVPYNESFISDHGEIEYPGDPAADPAEVYNCRCTVVTIYPKYEDRSKPNWRESEIIDGQSYQEWKASKRGQKAHDKEPTKSDDEFLTFDTKEDEERLERQRKEREQLKEEYSDINKEYYKTYSDVDEINTQLTKLDKLEKLRERDYSYFDRFNSEDELNQRREYLQTRVGDLYEKEDKLTRPRHSDFTNDDAYDAARTKWREEKDAISRERMELEKELYQAYNAPTGGWKGIEKWREARDMDKDTLLRKREELRMKKEQITAQRTELSARQTEIDDKIRTTYESVLVDTASEKGVDYLPPKRLTELPSTDRIIERLGGGDETEGSCASLGFCYIGQKNGIDVLDFRGGASREMFSRGCRDTLVGIAAETGKPLLREDAKSGTSGAVRLLKQCKPGREYYFVTGRHAAIVRKIDDHFEYLELQSAYKNGWKRFGEDEYYRDGKYTLDRTFEFRFGCDSKMNGESLMMDVDDMKDSNILKRSYGYMNTAESAQHKGASGHEK